MAEQQLKIIFDREENVTGGKIVGFFLVHFGLWLILYYILPAPHMQQCILCLRAF
jgi:hypothetical protein